jgi:hypothetical protein
MPLAAERSESGGEADERIHGLGKPTREGARDAEGLGIATPGPRGSGLCE